MSFDQNLTISPFKTNFPVSATRSLYVHGAVVGQAQFKSTREFHLKTVIKVPVLSKTGTAHLSSALNQQLQGTSFNGVSQLKLQVQNIDSSAVSWIPTEFVSGVLVGVVGGFFLSAAGSQGAVPGAIGIGLGAGLIGVGILHLSYGTIDYTLGVSGLEVQY